MDTKKLLSEMTLEEKLGQLTQLNAIFFKKDNTADITGPASKLHITEDDAHLSGSVLNFIGAKDMKEIQKVAMELQPHAGCDPRLSHHLSDSSWYGVYL